GMLAAMYALAALGESPAGTTLSSLCDEFSRYVSSGEINTTVTDPKAVIAKVKQATEEMNMPGVTLDELDGLTVAGDSWWFNLRPSNTEPLLRLNAEGSTAIDMQRTRDNVLRMISEYA
ncbi:MAG: phosphomannomutase/phosphoglucomutase, partial [Actinobacteria bacterium]|nr:phosphomannomutase/phosphoglucomutase [Actinomycetota bacterium]